MHLLAKHRKDAIKQTKRRGKKLVVVKEEGADRYHIIVIGILITPAESVIPYQRANTSENSPQENHVSKAVLLTTPNKPSIGQ
ncbi:hypothetical protein [Halalkalicoccus jeotgali]|uniref:Uncharacterized protein n=1 Tax=Halalkalicoccus jeotgali (strain DSM 18796 / CECT 7217 / JCM 14584 / KCTC 4019 / B3) TaxID=795797 RepID=D8JB61_HALJB|nr:hypothetical protein [Halalkalicoccus jeotgali]ADJ16514.1 hypothetical protein HacjB3_15771 [Halalkalicoccus jeotgali B3]ELY41391.1 hypothetical protein C497_01485 [Halalkalicoccus jeotgali B3]